MPTTGVATHSHTTFATTVPATMNVGTIPAGSYGTNPTLVVIIAATWNYDPLLFGLFTSQNTMLVDNGSSTVNCPLQNSSSGGVPTYGGALSIRTVPTGFLDPGATVKLTFIGGMNTSAAWQEAGSAMLAVVTYDAGDERDGLEDFYGATTLAIANPATGSFSTVPFLGGTYQSQNVSAPQLLTKFGKQVSGDATTKLALCLVALPLDFDFPSSVTFNGANWSTVETFESGLIGSGPNTVKTMSGIGLWARPAVLDTSFNVSCNFLEFTNGVEHIFTLNNNLPLVSRRRSFAMVVG